jgi:cytochrome P450
VPLEGDDVSELIAKHRDELPMSDQLPTLDPPVHTDHRALLMRLITPEVEGERVVWRLADRRSARSSTPLRLVGQFASPFACVIATLGCGGSRQFEEALALRD